MPKNSSRLFVNAPQNWLALQFMPIDHPAAEIVKAVKEWPANLIVIGSHGRGGIQRAVLGSVAEAVNPPSCTLSGHGHQGGRIGMPVTSGEQLPTAAPVQSASLDETRRGVAGDLNGGLTSDEARGRLEKFGPNAMPDTSMRPFRMALEKFWAPVPWMLEAAVLLELVLGEYIEAAVIAGLLVFNAALGLFQEVARRRPWRR